MALARLLLSLPRVQGVGGVGRSTPISASTAIISRGKRELRKQELSSSFLDDCTTSGRLFSPLSSRQVTSIGMIDYHALHLRTFAAAPVKQDEYNEVIEDINSKFADAREEIGLAAESKETVYFNDEAETAKKAVMEVLDLYNGLLARLSESERGALQRSMGLKMEQLKAELAQLDE